MHTKLPSHLEGSVFRLHDEHGAVIGWIPFPQRHDPVGQGRETVFLVRPQEASFSP